MVDLPANVSYTKITGRISLVVMDTTGDINDLPERIPAVGRVFLTPNTALGLIKDISTLDLFAPQVIEITLDASGQIVDKHGNQWVMVVSGDDPDIQPQNWTYTVSFDIAGVKINSFSFLAKSGETIDLSTVTPVAASTGTALSIAEAAAASAATSAAAAAASAAGGGGTGGLTAEQIQDMLATFFVAGTGIQLTYNDLANTYTITNTGATGGATLDVEAVRDAIGAALVGGTGIQITVNDAADTITISNTSPSDPEFIRDTIGAAMRVSDALTLNVNDAADTITVGLSAGLFLSQMGWKQIFNATSATTWPTRTLLPGYTLGSVIFNSESFPGMTVQPPGLDGDIWQRTTA